MLYALRYYSVPLLLAALIHVAAVGALYVGWNPVKQETREFKPRIVQSQLLVFKPEIRQMTMEQPVKETPTRVDTALDNPETERQPVTELETVSSIVEQEQRRELKREEQRLADLNRQSFVRAIETEAKEISKKSAERVAASYRIGIYQRVVANWSRPLNARLGMQAKLLVELIPTGRVMSVTVVESSGNVEFDRSAEAAVNKAREFEVPAESDVFERHFRQFSLLFKPEDLLR